MEAPLDPIRRFFKVPLENCYSYKSSSLLHSFFLSYLPLSVAYMEVLNPQGEHYFSNAYRAPSFFFTFSPQNTISCTFS